MNASDIKNELSWEYCKGATFCATITLNCNGSPGVCLQILHTHAKHQNVILLGPVFQAWCLANVTFVGKLTADFIAIINFGSQESHLQSTQHEPRNHAQNKQLTLPVYHLVAYRLAYWLLHLVEFDSEHRHQSNSNLFFLFKHVGTGQSNVASPKIGSPNRTKSW